MISVEPIENGRRPAIRILVFRILRVLAVLLCTLPFSPPADSQPLTNPSYTREQAAKGKSAYAEQCASCHGASLEGQPNWRHRLPNGRLPAPPQRECPRADH